MQSEHEQWPRTRWGLSAPASYVLLNGAEASGSEAFKLALFDLVTRGTLRLTQLEQRKRFWRTERVSALAQGSKAVPGEAPELGAVHELFRTRAYGDGEAVPVEALARTARAHYGSIGNYTRQDVLPALVSRGLYRAESQRMFFIFPRTRYVLTGEGEAARTELKQQLDIARQRLGGWVAADLARAVALVSLAGASLLLVSELYPNLQQLHRELERLQAADSGSSSSDGGTSSSGGETTSDSDRGGEPGPEGEQGDLSFGGLDLSALSFDFDLSAFESIGEAFSSIDAGVDSGDDEDGGDGGDGGGDGGGGD